MPNDGDAAGATYEFRVWGKRKRVRRQLADLADDISTTTVSDCYFLSDDTSLNAKVRSDSLKIKELIGRERGFQKWVTTHHRTAETAPEPFDELADDLSIRKARKPSWDLAARVDRLDPSHPTRPVFVTKERTLFRLGDLQAEATAITIDETGEVLHTIAIEGDDLDALVALRKTLGLKGTTNVAVHTAIEEAI